MSGRGVASLALGLMTLAAGGAAGQVPGVPALQNAFSSPGLAVAGNYAGGGGQSFFGAAAGYGFGSGRILASAAAGAQRANGSTRGAYGGRAAMNLWTSSGGSLGAGAFVGIGGAMRTRQGNVTSNPAVIHVPAGISVGYRRSLGATRGMSVYASPLYRWTRINADTVSTTTGAIAGAVGLDFAISQSFGLTVGAEFGKASGSSRANSTIGVALSFVPGR